MSSGIDYKIDEFLCNSKNVKKRRNTRLEKCYGHVNIATAFTKSCCSIQKNALISQKVFIRKKCSFNSLKVVIQENAFNLLKLFIHKMYSFAKTVNLQKLFIRKNCFSQKGVHSQKLFILTRAKVQNLTSLIYLALIACIFCTFDIPLGALARCLAQKTCL